MGPVTGGSPGGPYAVGPHGTAVLEEPGAVLGDPLSVEERPITDAEPGPEYGEFGEDEDYAATAIPVKLPPELAQYAYLEYRHDPEDDCCPCIVATFKADVLTGPPSAWLELCRLIAAITEQGPCMRCQRARGEAAHHGSAASRAAV